LSIKNAEEEAKEERERGRKLSEQILESTKQLRALRKKTEDQRIEMEKRLLEEEEKIREETKKKSEEDHRFKDLEKEKIIGDLKKALEEAQRKASQGSQQLQGEVLELDLEKNLRSGFPKDKVEEIAKGTVGADIRQTVKSSKGYLCGIILWESKRTKAWSNKWIDKLKADMRREKANIPIIVTTILPEQAKNGIGFIDGVWVCSHSYAIILATLIRNNLHDVARERFIIKQKDSSKDQLYDYITGYEFRQQVEAIVEVYQEMNIQIQKERISFEKSWKAREMQIRKLVLSTANVYGSMQGLVGSPSMPQVKGLDLFELDDGK